jgi:hypothetical protein
MSKVTRYIILTAAGTGDLESRIERYLALGWQPYGEMYHRQGYGWYHAMVRYANDE